MTSDITALLPVLGLRVVVVRSDASPISAVHGERYLNLPIRIVCTELPSQSVHLRNLLALSLMLEMCMEQ
ncbi:hypothetical protein V2G26_014046 [Clonostachys chloroleuca]